MWLIPKGDLSCENLAGLVAGKIRESRFTARVDTGRIGMKWGVKVSVVRLRNKKDYCGAHPGPCINNGLRHMKSHYLEGLDWVGFNALLNDLLDKLKADCDVFSFNRESLCSKYFIRKGRCRRVYYPYEYRNRFAHWTQGNFASDFADHCGKRPPARDEQIVNDGTPGYDCYTLAEEAKRIAVETGVTRAARSR